MPNWKKVIVSGSNAVLNNITASGQLTALNDGFTVSTANSTELEVKGNISASGNLFAGLTENSSDFNTVMYDTTNGQFYYTGSYGGGGGTGEPGDPGTTVTANTGDPSDTPLTSITIGGDNFSIAGKDDDWGIEGNTSTGFISSSRNVQITGSTNTVNSPSLEVRRSNSSDGPIFRVNGQSNATFFEVSENNNSTLFTVNNISSLPVFTIEDNGDVLTDGNLIFEGTSGNGLLLINGTTDLNNLRTIGNARGEIVKFGSDNTVAGNLYFWTGDNWVVTGVTTPASRYGLLAIALTNGTSADGMLIRGIINVAASSISAGQQVYMGNGVPTTTAPSSNGDTLRSVGHAIQNDVIYFNPSPDYIVISP